MTSPGSDPATLLDSLNPAQREAVELTHGPLLVLAGAGSGKTRVITYRLAYLISHEGVPAHQILALTFTNKAAGEMRDRVFSLLGLPTDFHLPIGTFHSRCAAILRREAVKVGLSEHYQILDEDDQRSAMKEVLKRLDIPTKKVQPGQAIEVISLAKNNLLGPESLEDIVDLHALPYREIYQAYQEYLSANDAVDFDDLLLKVVRLFESDVQSLSYWRRRYPFVLVDEYQDTNPVQFRLLQLLAEEHRNLCVVGDEDQSIYSWRGADINNLLDFQKHFQEAKIVRLEQNYRSTKRILRVADAVIRHNTKRLGKNLYTEGEEGLAVEYFRALDGLGEADWVASQIEALHLAQGSPYNQFAVFYRINSLSRAIEDALRYRRIPYRVVGGIRFYERKEIRDLVSYLRLAVNPATDVALQRVINTPHRGIGDTTQQRLRQFAMAHNLTLYPAARQAIDTDELRGKAAERLGEFLDQIDQWHALHDKEEPADLLKRILKDTDYIEELGDPDRLETISRVNNIEELTSTLAEWSKEFKEGHIADWLDQVALLTPSETSEGNRDGVSLMTIHAAKGLEFDNVFMIGLEEPIFPLARAIDQQGDAEEERRLFYVGVTRTRRRLHVTHTRSRLVYGSDTMNPPSRFLYEIPRDLFSDAKGPHSGRRTRS